MMIEWKSLLNNVEELLDVASSSQKSEDGMLLALDMLSEQWFSGEEMGMEYYGDMMRILVKFLKLAHGSVDYWHWKQLYLFSSSHVYAQVGDEEKTMELLKRAKEYDVGSVFVKYGMTDAKRETRDACAQHLGNLSKAVGNAVFEEVLHPSLIADLLHSDKKPTIFEGSMMSVGYLLANCQDISENNFNPLMDVLISNATNDNFGDYSRYVRLHAIRGLSRCIQCLKCIQSFPKFSELKDIVKNSIFDGDIDVRRAAAHFFANYFNLVGITEGIQSLHSSNRDTWQNRHGIACVFHCIARYYSKACENDDISVIVDTCKEIIHTEDEDKSAFVANGEACYALSRLTCALKEKEGDIFESVLLPSIQHMLQSQHPQMLDSAAQCISILIGNYSKIGDYFSEFCLVYKNKFHAAYPIRSSASIAWNQAKRSLYYTEDDSVILTKLTSELISQLLNNLKKSNNYEDQESIFKAFGSLFKYTKSKDATTDFDSLVNLFLKHAQDTTIRNSSYPQSAAISALGYLLSLGYSQKQDIPSVLPDVIALLRDYLPDVDEPSICQSCLLVVQVCLTKLREFLQEELPFLVSTTFRLSKMVYEDQIKFSALPLVEVAMDNDSNRSFIFSACLNEMRDCMDEDTEETIRDAWSYVLRDFAIYSSHLEFTVQESVESVVSIVKAVFSSEENRESKLILSNTSGFLLQILKNNQSFRRNLAKGEDLQALFSIVASYVSGNDVVSNLDDVNIESIDYSGDLSFAETCVLILEQLDKLMNDEKASKIYQNISTEIQKLFPKISSKEYDETMQELEENGLVSYLSNADESIIQEWDVDDEDENDAYLCSFEYPGQYRFGIDLNTSPCRKSNQILQACIDFTIKLNDRNFAVLVENLKEFPLTDEACYILYHVILNSQGKFKSKAQSLFINWHENQATVWNWRLLEALIQQVECLDGDFVTAMLQITQDRKRLLTIQEEEEKVLVSMGVFFGWFGHQLQNDQGLQFSASVLKNENVIEGKQSSMERLFRTGFKFKGTEKFLERLLDS